VRGSSSRVCSGSSGSSSSYGLVIPPDYVTRRPTFPPWNTHTPRLASHPGVRQTPAHLGVRETPADLPPRSPRTSGPPAALVDVSRRLTRPVAGAGSRSARAPRTGRRGYSSAAFDTRSGS
jgi:hypothetical protein